MAQDWEKTAQAKRRAILACIPKEWILNEIPTPEEQKDVTGIYVRQLLTDKEIEITETDAVGIVDKAASGTWTAGDITKAFCHRAAIAHQLVSFSHPDQIE
jgi:amidase